MGGGQLSGFMPASVSEDKPTCLPIASETDLVSSCGQPNKVVRWKNLHLDTMETSGEPHQPRRPEPGRVLTSFTAPDHKTAAMINH